MGVSVAEREMAVKAAQVQKRFRITSFRVRFFFYSAAKQSSEKVQNHQHQSLPQLLLRFDLEVKELKRRNYQLKTQIEAILQTKN